MRVHSAAEIRRYECCRAVFTNDGGTSDDVTMRISEAADGAEAVEQVLVFAQALSSTTTRP